MRLNFNLVAKIGLLLVVIGFFMPIFASSTGWEIGKGLMKADKYFTGILTYIVFISAIIGVVFGGLSLTGKTLSGGVNWGVIIACVASGLIVYLTGQNSNFISKAATSKLATGGVLILIGWIVAVAAQVLSALKRES